MNPRPRASLLTLALLALPALAAQAPAQTTYTRTFTMDPYEISGLNVWTAKAEQAGFPLIFLGPDLKRSGSIDAFGELKIGGGNIFGQNFPEVNLGKTGFQLRYRSDGRVGFELQPVFTGGKMDLLYRGVVNVKGLPVNPKPGTTYTLTMEYGAARSSHFSTTSPGFGLGVTAVADLEASADATAWFLGEEKSNGNLFSLNPGRTKSYRQSLLTSKEFTQGAIDGYNGLLGLANLANPTGISGSLSVPDLAVTGETIDASGTLRGSSFSPFLTVNTSLMAWALATLPLAGSIISDKALNGSIGLAGTQAKADWTIASLYANLNVGCRSDYAVIPDPYLNMDIVYVDQDRREQTLPNVTRSGNTITFTMPNYPIILRPRATVNLDLESKIGVGMSGEIGTTPFRFTIDGVLGSGDYAQTSRLVFDPAHYDWKLDSDLTANRKTERNLIQTLRKEFGGMTLTPANTTDFPPFLVTDVNDVAVDPDTFAAVPTLKVSAFGMDGDTSFKPRYTVKLYAPARYTLLAGTSQAIPSVKVLPDSGPLTANQTTIDTLPAFEPVAGTVKVVDARTDYLTMEFDSSLLRPGRYTMLVRMETDTGKKATYRVPMTINYKTALWGSDQFYTDTDKIRTINRVTVKPNDTYQNANGTQTVETAFYAEPQWLYHDTEVVMNGTEILRSDVVPNDPNSIANAGRLKFYLSNSVARRFAGTINKIQLRTRDMSGDGTTYILSEPRTLYIPVKIPILDSIVYSDKVNAALPLTNEAMTFQIKGKELAPATVLTMTVTDVLTGFTFASAVKSTYSSSESIFATLSAAQVALIVQEPVRYRATISAATPKVLMEVDSDHPLPRTETGGFSKSIELKFGHRLPTVTRMEPALLTKDGGSQSVRIYGENLVVPSLLERSSFNEALAGGVLTGPEAAPGTTVPYLDVVFPGDSPFVTEVAPHSFKVKYFDKESAATTISTAYGKPSIDTSTTYRVVMGRSSFGTMTLTGAPFYKGNTSLTINGNNVVATVANTTTLSALVFSGYPGASATVQLKNPSPGGGLSNEVKVILAEGDESTMKVVPGPLVLDRASGNYKQSLAVTYTGSRDVSSGIRIEFGASNDVKLVNASGMNGNRPYLSAFPAAGRTVNVVAIWSKTATGKIDPSSTVRFPY